MEDSSPENGLACRCSVSCAAEMRVRRLSSLGARGSMYLAKKVVMEADMGCSSLCRYDAQRRLPMMQAGGRLEMKST